ncbi:hypothetical protein L6452_29181 [Arctium lappa]|uniref:Uncharacterized protein n=1 Tax=Arctium lappa TaxID=4217 RepID=A0ACB8ZFB2_ARCLA|nr:hypothetical protein L6452_29181 [Arctium lappa]
MDLQNFPQPTRPLSFSKLTSFKYSAAVTPPFEAAIIFQDSEPSTSISSRQQPDEDEVFGELTQILLECLENVDNKHKGLLLQKVFSELEKESELESFIMERLKHTEVKFISEFLERFPSSLHGQIGEEKVNNYDKIETVSRGFDDDLVEANRTGQSMEEFSHKLERFKVKTIVIEGGVIKK